MPVRRLKSVWEKGRHGRRWTPLAGGEDRPAPCTSDNDLPAGRLFTIPATHPLYRPGGTSIFVAGPAHCRRKLKLGLLSGDTGGGGGGGGGGGALSLVRGLTVVK